MLPPFSGSAQTFLAIWQEKTLYDEKNEQELKGRWYLSN